MSPVRKIVACLVVALAAVACTKKAPSVSPSTSSGATTTPSSSVSQVPITPGEFEYQNAGLDVKLDLKTSTMVVDNGSGHDLAKPDLYVFLATGKRVDGKVTDAAPITNGAKQTFHVEFPPEVNDKSVGLVILLFGSDNYGAFAPA